MKTVEEAAQEWATKDLHPMSEHNDDYGISYQGRIKGFKAGVEWQRRQSLLPIQGVSDSIDLRFNLYIEAILDLSESLEFYANNFGTRGNPEWYKHDVIKEIDCEKVESAGLNLSYRLGGKLARATITVYKDLLNALRGRHV